MEQILRPFIKKWGALPPVFELVASDPKYRMELTVLSGKWGAVPVFPWMTDRDLRAAVGRIRKTIGKVDQDSETSRRAALAQWLEMHVNGEGPPWQSMCPIESSFGGGIFYSLQPYSVLCTFGHFSLCRTLLSSGSL